MPPEKLRATTIQGDFSHSTAHTSSKRNYFLVALPGKIDDESRSESVSTKPPQVHSALHDQAASENTVTKKRAITTYGDAKRARHQHEVQRRNKFGTSVIVESLGKNEQTLEPASNSNLAHMSSESVKSPRVNSILSTSTSHEKRSGHLPSPPPDTSSTTIHDATQTVIADPIDVVPIDVDQIAATAVTNQTILNGTHVTESNKQLTESVSEISDRPARKKATKSVTWDLPDKSLNNGRGKTEKEKVDPKPKRGARRIITEFVEEPRLRMTSETYNKHSGKNSDPLLIEPQPIIVKPSNLVSCPDVGTGLQSELGAEEKPTAKSDSKAPDVETEQDNASILPDPQSLAHSTRQDYNDLSMVHLAEHAIEPIHAISLCNDNSLHEASTATASRSRRDVNPTIKRTKTRRKAAVTKKKDRGRTTMTFVDIKSRTQDEEKFHALFLPNRDNRRERQPVQFEATRTTPVDVGIITNNDSDPSHPSQAASTQWNRTQNSLTQNELGTSDTCNQTQSVAKEIEEEPIEIRGCSGDSDESKQSDQPGTKTTDKEPQVSSSRITTTRDYERKRLFATFFPSSVARRMFRTGLSKRAKVPSLHSYLKR